MLGDEPDLEKTARARHRSPTLKIDGVLQWTPSKLPPRPTSTETHFEQKKNYRPLPSHLGRASLSLRYRQTHLHKRICVTNRCISVCGKCTFSRTLWSCGRSLGAEHPRSMAGLSAHGAETRRAPGAWVRVAARTDERRSMLRRRRLAHDWLGIQTARRTAGPRTRARTIDKRALRRVPPAYTTLYLYDDVRHRRHNGNWADEPCTRTPPWPARCGPRCTRPRSVHRSLALSMYLGMGWARSERSESAGVYTRLYNRHVGLTQI